MKLQVKYSILFLLSLVLFLMTTRAVARNVSPVDASDMQVTLVQEAGGIIYAAPVCLYDANGGELTVDLSHFSSDVKFYTKRFDLVRIVDNSDVFVFSEIRGIYFFSISDPAAYYVFGLRKIIV